MGVGGQGLDPVTLSQGKNPMMLCESQIQSERVWRTGSLFTFRTDQRVFLPATLTRPPCIIITYSEYVSVALVIKHAMRKRHIVICGLFANTIFFALLHKRYDFPKKKLLNVK